MRDSYNEFDGRRSAVDGRLSTVGCRRSAVDGRLSTFGCRRSAVDGRLSTVDSRRFNMIIWCTPPMTDYDNGEIQN